MNKTYVLIGLITFLEEQFDGEFKATIHQITEIKSFDTSNEAEEYGEEQITNGCGESYLIPQVYGGAIELETQVLKKSDLNLMVIENFILYVTHSSDEDNDKTPMTLTPSELYQMARNYIEEDHVDGIEGDE